MRLRLESLSDMKYRDFTAKLIPNLGKDRIMGVRTPDIRALAKELYGTKEGEDFLLCESAEKSGGMVRFSTYIHRTFRDKCFYGLLS